MKITQPRGHAAYLLEVEKIQADIRACHVELNKASAALNEPRATLARATGGNGFLPSYGMDAAPIRAKIERLEAHKAKCEEEHNDALSGLHNLKPQPITEQDVNEAAAWLGSIEQALHEVDSALAAAENAGGDDALDAVLVGFALGTVTQAEATKAQKARDAALLSKATIEPLQAVRADIVRQRDKALDIERKITSAYRFVMADKLIERIEAAIAESGLAAIMDDDNFPHAALQIEAKGLPRAFRASIGG